MNARDLASRWFVRTALLCPLLSGGLASTASEPKLTGKLATTDGVRVLTLWGGAYERGYAHGYLVGDGIMAIIESCLLDPRVLKAPGDYETLICDRFLSWMDFGKERIEELEGMLAGITAAVGAEHIRLERLDRDLSVTDLQAINTLADWNGFFCSSFSAWGELEANGEMITGRNLDYLSLAGLRDRHLIIVYREPGKKRKRWVSIAWPGLIGAYTAMNEEGVTIGLHDACALPPRKGGPFKPRSIALRDAIEQATASAAIAEVEKVLRASPVIVGNNIPVSAPFVGQKNPAAVFEYDADATRDTGATRRLASDNKAAALTRAVVCTNHYRKRAHSVPCDRYDKMEAALIEAARGKRGIDVAAAQRILNSVAVPGTLQSVVFLPNRKEFHLRLATPGRDASQVAPVRFELSALFAD